MNIDINDVEIVSDYFKNEKLRNSFNELAIKTFSLDFEMFYKNRLYFKRYIPYSIVKDDKIIANVSVNRFNLILDRIGHKSIQLGTVMTDKEYRGNGLSRMLMEHIINVYKDSHDIMFLYANNSVLDFYPKFGFERVIETYYEIDVNKIAKKPAAIRLLDINSRQDSFILSSVLKSRAPISKTVGVTNDKWPVLANISIGEYDCDYIIDDDIIVVGKREHEQRKYHVYDIISKKAIVINDIIEKLNLDDCDVIRFYFPVHSYKYDFIGIEQLDENDTLFVRSKTPLNVDLTFSPIDHT